MLYVIDHHVTARVARFTYGTIGSRVYQNGNKEHRSRNNKTHVSADGIKRVHDSFFSLVDVVSQYFEASPRSR